MVDRGRKQKAASYSEETQETHFAGKITEKRHNFDPSTPAASAENLHCRLNRETRRAPGPPVAPPRWLGKTQTR
jgi:hypothetical protein